MGTKLCWPNTGDVCRCLDRIMHDLEQQSWNVSSTPCAKDRSEVHCDYKWMPSDTNWSDTDIQRWTCTPMHQKHWVWPPLQASVWKKELKMARCNWIKPELGTPELYCSWGCTPLMGFKGQVYWEEEAVYLQATPLAQLYYQSGHFGDITISLARK